MKVFKNKRLAANFAAKHTTKKVKLSKLPPNLKYKVSFNGYVVELYDKNYNFSGYL